MNAIIRTVSALFLVVVLAMATEAQTTGWVELRTNVSLAGTTPRLEGLINHSFTPKSGAFVWFQVDPNYAEGYAGFTFSPKEWIQGAVGAGMEQAGSDKLPFRLGGYLWVGKGRYTGLLILEGLGSGTWYAVETNAKINETLGIGSLTRQFEGSGPRAELNIKQLHLKVWGAVMFQESRDKPVTAAVGVRINF